MSETVIRVENLSKRYLLRHRQESSGDGLRHAIQDAVSFPFKKAIGHFRKKKPDENGSACMGGGDPLNEVFWALKDINFEVKSGEVIGVVGRNGAGKSTLLKILSRITEPTSGRIGIKGRVASLLEVGTGFHPELSGRENIYLNGAILGMSRTEIKTKFDQIVTFAEIEKFLDTPVKRYSSGMYVRLAFAVAAHLEPEILIVDEVLAVGDLEFQKKCLGKMSDVAAGGRTILFVSHNLVAVNALCSSCLVLTKGQNSPLQSTEAALQEYVQVKPVEILGNNLRDGTGELRLKELTVEPSYSAPHDIRTIRFTYEGIGARSGFLILLIADEFQSVVLRCDSRLTSSYLKGSSGAGLVTIRSPWLKPGRYTINAYIDSGMGYIDVWDNAAEFIVDSNHPYSNVATLDVYKHAPVLADFEVELSNM